MLYKETHPDFDNGNMFETLLETLESYGFKDISYKNDACPSIGFCLDDRWLNSVQIWVDYDDQSQSDFYDADPADYTRYNLQLRVNDADVKSYRTNEFYEAVYYAHELLNEIKDDPTVTVKRRLLKLSNYDDETVQAYVFETEGQPIEEGEFLENTLHIELSENGNLSCTIANDSWCDENTPENLERNSRYVLGFGLCEHYYDAFPLLEDAAK